MLPYDFKSKPYTEMTQKELETIVIDEIKNIASQGIVPTVQNYGIYRRTDAPQYPTIRSLTKTGWKELVKRSGVTLPERKLDQKNWKDVSDKEMLDITLNAMHQLDRVTFNQYQTHASSEAPSLPTVMNRLDCTWNDLVKKYVDKYSKENLKPKKNVHVPYERYQELIAIEKEYIKLRGD